MGTYFMCKMTKKAGTGGGNPELQYDPNIFMDMRHFPGLYVCFEHTSHTQYERQICLGWKIFTMIVGML